jgi:hypothetical protein
MLRMKRLGRSLFRHINARCPVCGWEQNSNDDGTRLCIRPFNGTAVEARIDSDKLRRMGCLRLQQPMPRTNEAMT